MATDIQLEQYKTMIKYCGYTGISLDGFSVTIKKSKTNMSVDN